MKKEIKNVLVAGGAGYVGAVLIPKLLNSGYNVTVFDLYLYGDDVLKSVKGHPSLREIKGDLRDLDLVDKSLEGIDSVIHLACISNDPSFELNPDLGKSINYECFEPFVLRAKNKGVGRFIYASSSSVYGVKEEENVTEDLKLEPLTDYSKFKALCEQVLLRHASEDFTSLIVRPATVCGYSPRLRLDLTVNILTNHAVNNGKIKVFGGNQKRPNIHIQDMTNFYVQALKWPHEKIHKQIFNAGYENYTLDDIALLVKKNMHKQVTIEHSSTDDNRSYHVSSQKLERELGFAATHSIEDAVRGLIHAFDEGLIPNSMVDSKYFNIKKMQEVNLK